MSRPLRASFTLPIHPHPSVEYTKQSRARLANDGYTVLDILSPMSPSLDAELERIYCIYDPDGPPTNKRNLTTREGKWRDAIKEKIFLAIYPKSHEGAKLLMETKELYARLYNDSPSLFLQDLVLFPSGAKKKAKLVAPMNMDSKGWGLPHPYIIYHNPDRFALHRYLTSLALSGERVASELIWYITASLLETVLYLRGDDEAKDAPVDAIEHGQISTSTIILPQTQFAEHPYPRVLLAHLGAKCRSKDSQTKTEGDDLNTTHVSATDLRQIAVVFHGLAHDEHLRVQIRTQKRWNWTQFSADGTCKCAPAYELPQGVPSAEDLEFTPQDKDFNEFYERLYDSKGVGLKNSEITDLVEFALRKRDEAIKRQHRRKNYRVYGTELFC